MNNSKENVISRNFRPYFQNGYSVATILWILFFCYTTFIALIFQKLLLPLIPSLHGASGLLNADSMRLLSRHPECKINLPKPVKYYKGDLTEKSSELINFVDGVDILYHCAGEIRDQGKMHAVHVTGTKNLCEAASGKIGHWAQLSSVGTYGFHASGTIKKHH